MFAELAFSSGFRTDLHQDISVVATVADSATVAESAMTVRDIARSQGSLVYIYLEK